jgi:D-alanyl-D-alanine carboxypeptidase (penicillin-binding protein 5/6)
MILGLKQKFLLGLLALIIGILHFVESIEYYFLAVFKLSLRVFFAFLLLFMLAFSYDTQYVNSDIGLATPTNFLPTVKSAAVSVYPIKINFTEPFVSAEVALVYDNLNKQVIFNKNAEIQIPPASTSKLMTALIALDIYDLEEELEMPEICVLEDIQRVGFIPGEKIKVKDLIQSLLVSSAGDSACILSLSAFDGDPTPFIKLMNNKARSLNMYSSYFSNPIGIDDGNNISSAEDLLKLTLFALQNDFISESVKIPLLTINSGDFPRQMRNTNILLETLPGTVGVKTGTTEGAKQALINRYINESSDLITIVVRSEDRYQDTTNMIFWAQESFEFIPQQ